MTQVNTEKIPGRVANVYIGYDATHGTQIKSGIKGFWYEREHDVKPKDASNSKASSNAHQPHSYFKWRLELMGDCRVAFFATDVQVAGGNQYAMVPDGDSNKIEYFKIDMKGESESGVSMTRTYTLTDAYASRNGTRIGDDLDTIYWYEGICKSISYSDA